MKTIIFTAVGLTSNAAAISVAACDYMLGDVWNEYSKDEKDKLREALEDKCGAEAVSSAKSSNVTVTAKKGLCITEKLITTLPQIYSYEYTAYNSNTLKGEKWSKGKWDF